MGKVVIISNLSRELPGWDEAINMIKQSGHDVIDIGSSYDGTTIILKDADALIVGLNQIERDIIENAPKLKIIAKPGIGVDNIDLETATRNGIIVSNTPGSNSDSVADHLFVLMLSVTRKIVFLDTQTKNGKGWINYPVIGNEISNKTLGVIGTGAIGKEVVNRALGFKMQIYAYDPFPDYNWAINTSVEYVDINRLLQKSDVITLHLPLTEQTKYLIDYEQFEQMKQTAYIFNTSRGGVINESALFDALKSNKIAGAGIDVFEEEPLQSNELFKFDNVVVTPHIGGFSKEASYRSRIMTAENIISVFNNQLPYIANHEVLEKSNLRVNL
ncbi:phosphoglycerate dehydrogenase [Bacillus sp. JJ1533]|uniref:phosphoglycerate dehydrogenase n=1 Tax=Bacillus sp. JJ1533 TaxID=3122959 RepID=UPI003000BF30